MAPLEQASAAEASSQVAPASTATQDAAPVIKHVTIDHNVVHGDTLWDLAEKYYGDGQRYPEIFEANRGVTQADGRALSDPDLIITGWTLAVPNVQVEEAPPAPTPDPPAPADPGDSVTGSTGGEGIGVDGSGGDGSGGAVGGATGGQDVQQETNSTDQPGAQDAPATGDALEDDASDADYSIPLTTTGGAVGLLVAGLLAALGTRRLRQRRKRLAGERIAMPSQAAADLELELRLVENPIGVEDIDNALRGLQAWAEDTGALLPELLAVRLADDEIAVYLTEPADLPEPFEAAHPDHTAWVVRPGRAEPPTRPTVSPYPALTTIGTDDAGGVLLLDLEQIGSLNVVGDEETARGVLTAIAVELAVNPWSDQIQVTLVGMPHGLAHDLGRFRVQHVDDVPALIRNLRADMEDRRAALDSYDVDDVHQARVKATDLESWAPHIVILGMEPPEAQRTELAELVAHMPRLGIATVASGDSIEAGSTVVITDCTTAEYRSGGQLPPLPFHPQLLAGEELRLIQNLFDTTAQKSHVADLAAENVVDERALPEDDDAEITVGPLVDETEGAAAQEPDAPLTDDKLPVAEEAPALVDDESTSAPQTETGDAGVEISDLDIEPKATADEQEIPVDVALAILDRAPDWPAPNVRMLGPVDALNVPEKLPGRGVEMMTYLLLHGGQVPGAQLQKAFWPDKLDQDDANNARQLAKHLRNVMGADPDGHKLLPEGRKEVGFLIHPASSTPRFEATGTTSAP